MLLAVGMAVGVTVDLATEAEEHPIIRDAVRIATQILRVSIIQGPGLGAEIQGTEESYVSSKRGHASISDKWHGTGFGISAYECTGL